MTEDPRIAALPDIHGHAKGEHKPFAEERPIPYTARMLFLWFFHACRRGSPRFLMVADHMNYLTFEDPAAVNLVRRALKLAQAGDLYGAAETAGVDIAHAAAVSDGLRKGMRYSIGAEIDNDPRCRPDAQNIVDAMKPDGTVRSVHFIPITHPQHGENWLWAFDNPEFRELYDIVGTEAVWEIYMTTLLEAIEKLPGNIVGHFYVPAKFGHWPADEVLEAYEDRFLDACAERGMAVEVNSRYFYKFFLEDDANLAKYRAVHLRLLRKAKEKNVAIAVGSDAHSPKDQGAAFSEILALLDEAQVNEIAFPIGGRLARVALRATEEILRQHSAATIPVLAQASPGPLSGGSFEADDSATDDDGAAPSDAQVPASPLEPVAKKKRAASKTAASNGSADHSAPSLDGLTASPTAEPAEPAPADVKPPEVPRAPAPRKSRAKQSPGTEAARAVIDSVVDSVVEAAANVVPAATQAIAALTERITGKAPAPSEPAETDGSVPKTAVKPRRTPARAAAGGEATTSKPVAPHKTPVRATPAKAPAKAARSQATAPKAAPAAKAASGKTGRAPARKAGPAKRTAAEAPSKRPAGKAPASKKTSVRSGAVKKTARAAAAKPATRPAAAKKSSATSAAKRSGAKKTAAKKPAAKKSAAKKGTPARSSAKKPVKRPVTRKAAAKSAKKPAKRRR